MEFKKLIFEEAEHQDDYQALVDFFVAQSVYRVFRATNGCIYVQYNRTVISDDEEFSNFEEAMQFSQNDYEKKCKAIFESIQA